ncbi:hypothetical protein C1646_759200 [Rhizophagus diaphanus]|nr:hypothetical protein C1646_759200 [Rhizophagus diaphanus] [Rhizophagus sp. MUCL 43196]
MIPYPRSNDLLAKYQEEIAQFQVVSEEKRNETHDVSQSKSIDELADWLADPVKGSKLKESENIDPLHSINGYKGGTGFRRKRRVSHGWPSLLAHSYGKASLNELLLVDRRVWLSWKDSEVMNLDEYQVEPYNLELEGQPYTLRFQFMACPRQKLYGPGTNEDGTVWWHSDGLVVNVSYKMASEVCCLLYHHSTEYTLFTRLHTSEGMVEEMGDKGWHFGKKKKAGSLTGEEITPGQLKGIDEFLHRGTKRAIGLTPARESALAKFNEKVRAPSCTLDDLHVLEKPEKSGGIGMKIVVKNILGGIPEMPRVSSVYDMDYECERALVSACTKTKKGEVNIDEKKIAEALISFVAKNLPRATRIWIVGKEILTHEGILYRSSHEWKKLNDAFICEKSQSIPEELLWEENVDICQWIEDGYQSNTLAPSEELKAEFDKVLKSLGGAHIINGVEKWNQYGNNTNTAEAAHSLVVCQKLDERHLKIIEIQDFSAVPYTNKIKAKLKGQLLVINRKEKRNQKNKEDKNSFKRKYGQSKIQSIDENIYEFESDNSRSKKVDIEERRLRLKLEIEDRKMNLKKKVI